MALREVPVFDARLKHPFSMIISGPSSSGKTYFVKNVIEHASQVISHPIENIVYIYSCWQPAYDQLLECRDIRFIEGLPVSLADDTLLPPQKNNLLIVDDLMSQASQNSEMEKVFTQFCHHRNLSCMYIVQNFFCQGKASRTISLNTNYLVLYKNVRDRSQIMHLPKQMFPLQFKYFLESYIDATSAAYGYLLIDFKATTPDNLRLRTEIVSGLVGGSGCVVYIPRK